MGQLTLDGREVELGEANACARARGLTGAQAGILRVLAAQRSIRSVEAGLIVHRHRNGGAGCYGSRMGGTRGIGCCQYAAADGLAALNRLQTRGFVRRTFLLGRWMLA